MINILIAILQFLGVVANPDLLNNETFKSENEIQITRANQIYYAHQYHEVDGVVVVDDINPRN